MRKTSSKRHIRALIIAVGIVVFTLSLFYIREILESYDEYEYLPMVELVPVNLSELSMMELIYPEKLEIPKTEKKIKNTPPKIVSEEEDIPEPEHVEQTEALQITEDSTNLTADSILFAENKSKRSEMIEEPVTYILNPADSISKSQSLQTVILRYVYHNLKYPDVAYKQRIKGKVVYSFVVNKDGAISDITLIKGVYIFLDEEVLRVIRSIPILEPEKKEGKPIRVKFYLPVFFSLGA